MRLAIIMLILLGLAVSGCLSTFTKQVPVVKINVTFVEKQGIVEPQDITITEGTVDFAARPRRIQAESFPGIAGRVAIAKGKNTSIGPWENLPYKGNGTYSFNLAFKDDVIPEINDPVHVSIVVVDEKSERIGYVVRTFNWTKI